MDKLMLLLKPSEEVKSYADEVAVKFEAMHGVKLLVTAVKAVNLIANQIESGRVAIVFIETIMEKAELNSFIGCFVRAKTKPFVIVSMDNYLMLEPTVPRELLAKSHSAFTQGFMFNCVRNLLTPENKKLDIRYVKSIITSVAEVIRQNTKHKLVPKPILEAKGSEKNEELSVSLAFYGDGFLGSLSLTSTRQLISLFSQKMLFCEPEQVTNDVIMDVVGEISNQILGVVRQELSEFGYSLKASMQVVVVADKFSQVSTSNGRYYQIPFVYEGNKFDLTLCYNTYQTSIYEIEEEDLRGNKQVLDIRLVDLALDCFSQTISPQLGDKLVREGICQHLGEPYDSRTIQLFHVGSWQGGVILGMDVKKDAAAYIAKAIFKQEVDASDDSLINDVLGELMNQVGGNFLKKCKNINYGFHRVFHGGFSGSQLTYLLKNPGYYARFQFKMANHKVTFLFGTNSSFASQYFNVWPFYNRVPKFKQQFDKQQ